MSAMLRELRKSARAEGMALHPLKTSAPYLRSYGFAPDVVIEAGVGDGAPWLYRSFPNAQFVLIDPCESCGATIKDQGVLTDFHFHAAAVGAQDGRAALQVPVTDDGHHFELASLTTRTDKQARDFKRVETLDVRMCSLDHIAVAYPGRVGLKVKTEGAELAVLQGAKATLARCDFAILELSVTARFAGVGVPSAAVSLLAEAGLEMRDVLHFDAGGGKKARPRYIDVLFTRWAA